MEKSQDNWVQQWGILVNGLRAELVTWKNGLYDAGRGWKLSERNVGR